MLVSPELKQKIENAYIEMRVHPERALVPIRRKAIYDLLNLDDPFYNQRSFKWLAVITARRTLSIWRKRPHDDNLPEHLINVAEGRMNNAVSDAMANIEAGKAWERIENLGVVNDEAPISQKTFYVHLVAFEALKEVLGRDPFKGIIIDENDIDYDLDPWSSDTTLWAAAAHAGRIGAPDSDLQKRQTFWEWWLMEAIPIALNISAGNV